MEAPKAIESLRETGECEGTAVKISASTPIYSATTRYFPVRRVSVRYLVVCYNPFIGRVREFPGHSLINQLYGITQLHF